VDGVKDGLIQNPMACDFRPEVDLPRCPQDKAGDDCFTTAQVETLSTVLTAVTDENGRVVQPAYSVSELQAEFRVTPYPQDITVRDPWPDTGNPATGSGGMGTLANATLKVFANDNREDFYSRDLLTFARGGKGDVTGYRVVVPQKAVAHAREQLRMGIGGIPENLGKFIGQGSKMLIWHNLGDQLLTPYMSVNYYKQLAGLHGGYDKLQESVRLFSLPGTAHCSGGLLIGPGSFDALSAMEAWVEEGVAPNALLATAYPATRFSADFSKPPGRTMPLCMFPQMARYSGKGDVMDAANWHCPADDEGMLQIGESGRQAGVLP
jgi:feruloyl esterase